MLRDVYLSGALGREFGEGPHKLHVKGMRDFFSGMTYMFPSFMKELSKQSDMAIIKRKSDTNQISHVDKNHLEMMFGDWDEIYLLTGKQGALDPGTWAAIVTWWTNLAWYYQIAIIIVVNIAISAVMKALIHLPDTSESKSKADNKSTLFDKPDNKTVQGSRVQLIFGQCLVGSVTLSQRLRAVRTALGSEDLLSVVEGNTGTINIFTNDHGNAAPVVLSYKVAGSSSVLAGATFTAGNISIISYEEVNGGDSWYRIQHNTTGPAYTLNIAASGLVTLVTALGSGPLKVPVAVLFKDGTEPEETQTLNLDITEFANPYVGQDSGVGGGQ